VYGYKVQGAAGRGFIEAKETHLLYQRCSPTPLSLLSYLRSAPLRKLHVRLALKRRRASAPPAKPRPNSQIPPLADYQPLVLYQSIQDSIWTRPGLPSYSTYHYFTYLHGGATACATGTPFRVYLSNLAPPLDVDLFIGDASIPIPSSTNNTWSSTNSFAEIIDITPPAGSPNPCIYYIVRSTVNHPCAPKTRPEKTNPNPNPTPPKPYQNRRCPPFPRATFLTPSP
jgi:hypothetical protein